MEDDEFLIIVYDGIWDVMTKNMMWAQSARAPEA
jgi:serine/threonine protein phosphatase PrpC